MKVENTSEKNFEPVTISITFETEEEASAFYMVFNYGSVCNFVDSHGLDGYKIRDALGEKYYKGDYHTDLLDFIKK